MSAQSVLRKINLNNVRVPKMPGGGALPSLLNIGIVGGRGLYGVANSLYNVEGGHRAIVFSRVMGIKDKVYPEGTQFMIPWFERPIIYDIRARPHLVESTSGSHDLQMVKIGLRVLTRPNENELPEIYRTLGENSWSERRERERREEEEKQRRRRKEEEKQRRRRKEEEEERRRKKQDEEEQEERMRRDLQREILSWEREKGQERGGDE